MKRQQSGFTLIELIVVIVILGILAATAMPKFLDVKDDAGNAAAQGVAGGLASATAINYAAKAANKSYTVIGSAAGAACTEAAGSLVGGALPSGWSFSGTASCSGGTASCTVKDTNNYNAPVTVICTQ